MGPSTTATIFYIRMNKNNFLKDVKCRNATVLSSVTRNGDLSLEEKSKMS